MSTLARDIAIGVLLAGILLGCAFCTGATGHPIPFLSPPIPPVPPLCGPGITGDCVEWNEDLRDLRDNRFTSPLPQPPAPCGRRHSKNSCDD